MVFRDMSKTTIRNLQMQVERAIHDMVESGAERGLQVAVYLNGEQIVDAMAGVADPATGRLFTSETPVYCYSVCKAAASTLVHMLAERRAFGYDTRVAELWPEFGAHGKQGVTIRHVLNHTAGVPGIPLTTTIEDLCDWDKMCTAIADSEPWWEPGTKTSARAIARMYAALLGEVDGVRLLSPERLREATTAPVSGVDEVFGMPTTWALGYSMGVPGGETKTAFGVGGVGGSFAGCDAATGIAFAVTKNRLANDFNAATQIIGLVTKR